MASKVAQKMARRKLGGEEFSSAMMEPMLPEAEDKDLEDLSFDLIRKASVLAGSLRPEVRSVVGELVRTMNCYYSNLIEGHNTHPRDIDRALAQDFSTDTKKRSLQLEAKAHIEVQELIDANKAPQNEMSEEYLLWIHREFCKRLPEEFLWVENPDTKERLPVVPGELRTRDVAVGKHIPPPPGEIPAFLDRFFDAYKPEHLSKPRFLTVVAAAHHRLLWIHPFIDGNGRVTRLFSYALLKKLEIGNTLWSVSRGLARHVDDYKRLLQNADSPRSNNFDGRGQLSLAALREFCAFFLRICVDQVDYMTSLLQPTELLNRIELYTAEEIKVGRLPTGSFSLLREAVMAGQFEKSAVEQITGYRDRKAREILAALLKKKLLTAEGVRGPVRLGVPLEVVERWFPLLYPPL